MTIAARCGYWLHVRILRLLPLLLPVILLSPLQTQAQQSDWRAETQENAFTGPDTSRSILVFAESPSGVMDLPLSVPWEADLLRLYLVLPNPGARDGYTLFFDGEPIFSYQGTVLSQDKELLVVPLTVPIAHLKGRTGTLEIRLRSSATFAVYSVELATLSDGPPPGYYATVDSTSMSAMRATLHNIIDDHVRFPYTSSATDTWNILELADQDPENSANILDVYRNASYLKVGGGNDNYNREHTWPNSYGFPNDGATNYPYTDCHALFLSDSSYNSSRGNNPYRTCASGCTERPTDENNGQGGGTGIYPGNSNWRSGSGTTGSWETWIGRRGDVARALFYLDLRYEGGTHSTTGVSEPNLILTNNGSLIATTGGNASVAYMGILSTLLEWHTADPVDDRERIRNEAVASFQGNRNPFIDYPEWVRCALAGECAFSFSDGFENGDLSAWVVWEPE